MDIDRKKEIDEFFENDYDTILSKKKHFYEKLSEEEKQYFREEFAKKSPKAGGEGYGKELGYEDK